MTKNPLRLKLMYILYTNSSAKGQISISNHSSIDVILLGYSKLEIKTL